MKIVRNMFICTIVILSCLNLKVGARRYETLLQLNAVFGWYY